MQPWASNHLNDFGLCWALQKTSPCSSTLVGVLLSFSIILEWEVSIVISLSRRPEGDLSVDLHSNWTSLLPIPKPSVAPNTSTDELLQASSEEQRNNSAMYNPYDNLEDEQESTASSLSSSSSSSSAHVASLPHLAVFAWLCYEYLDYFGFASTLPDQVVTFLRTALHDSRSWLSIHAETGIAVVTIIDVIGQLLDTRRMTNTRETTTTTTTANSTSSDLASASRQSHWPRHSLLAASTSKYLGNVV